MARGLTVSWSVGACIALLGLLGVGIWCQSHPSLELLAPQTIEATLPTVESEPSTREPLRSVEASRSEPRAQDLSVTTEAKSALRPMPPTKAESLSKALEQRPPALADLQTPLRSDPERLHRYAARAARAKRLNQRLSQHIEELEARLHTANSADQSAIEAELSQLRANLVKRQDLERAAIPTPAARTGP